jgi:hypothetical protein
MSESMQNHALILLNLKPISKNGRGIMPNLLSFKGNWTKNSMRSNMSYRKSSTKGNEGNLGNFIMGL